MSRARTFMLWLPHADGLDPVPSGGDGGRPRELAAEAPLMCPPVPLPSKHPSSCGDRPRGASPLLWEISSRTPAGPAPSLLEADSSRASSDGAVLRQPADITFARPEGRSVRSLRDCRRESTPLPRAVVGAAAGIVSGARPGLATEAPRVAWTLPSERSGESGMLSSSFASEKPPCRSVCCKCTGPRLQTC